MDRLLVMMLVLVACTTPVTASSPDPQKMFSDAQRAYHEKDYDRALRHMVAYLEADPTDSDRRFGVVEQVARIHLQFKRDPAAAVAFLEATKKNDELSKPNAEALEQWLATAREWKKMGALQKDDNADYLFRLGDKYYKRGVSETDGPGDETGAASRYIAASYLVPFVLNFDGDPRLARALLMLGDIHRRSWKADEFWTVDFYLKEVIRRFPRTEEAKRAYAMLDEDIRMRWSGSGGDHTPDHLKTMLKRYREMAHGPAGAGDETTGPKKK